MPAKITISNKESENTSYTFIPWQYGDRLKEVRWMQMLNSIRILFYGTNPASIKAKNVRTCMFSCINLRKWTMDHSLNTRGENWGFGAYYRGKIVLKCHGEKKCWHSSCEHKREMTHRQHRVSENGILWPQQAALIFE